MTPVDAFDTMVLMGLKEESGDAKRLILNRLSFDQDVSVQVFEVTIRLLGGLISGCSPPSSLLPACRSATST